MRRVPGRSSKRLILGAVGPAPALVLAKDGWQLVRALWRCIAAVIRAAREGLPRSTQAATQVPALAADH